MVVFFMRIFLVILVDLMLNWLSLNVVVFFFCVFFRLLGGFVLVNQWFNLLGNDFEKFSLNKVFIVLFIIQLRQTRSLCFCDL